MSLLTKAWLCWYAALLLKTFREGHLSFSPPFSLSRSVSAHFPSLYSFDGVPCISHTGGLFIGSTCQEEVGNGGLLLQAGNSQQWPDEADVCVYLCVCEGKEMSARWQMKKERWQVKGFKTAKELQSVWTQFCVLAVLTEFNQTTQTHACTLLCYLNGTFHITVVQGPPLGPWGSARVCGKVWRKK